eukprot:CAMPEP_0119328244 /NCGR_PEP_ID=MMETSP1333-20130426/72851_1 /TAXON_ID=418940 /ORGANISM="Scyphosphaera apsteinii, Strain RCC1455" /LENGTH=448 /DNA_ID=CAMNT_0007337043 /DNA_START=222 /DNA_END=1569 /DNA_ORIENTATION=-
MLPALPRDEGGMPTGMLPALPRDEGGSYSIWGLPLPLAQPQQQPAGLGLPPSNVWTQAQPATPLPAGQSLLPLPQTVAPAAEPSLASPLLAVPAALQPAPAEGSAVGPSHFILHCKGLPFSATVEAVVNFFQPLEIADGGVHMKMNSRGGPCGECFVIFASETALVAALERNRQVMGHRYVLLERSSPAEFAEACPHAHLSEKARVAAGIVPTSSSAPVAAASLTPTGQTGARSMSATQQHSKHSRNFSGDGRGSHASSVNGNANGVAGHEAKGAESGSCSSVIGGSNGTANGSVSSGNVVIKMRGLPYSAAEPEIIKFFSALRIASGGVSIGRDVNGRASGEAHVEFCSEQDAQEAMSLNRQRIGNRYIELFRTKQQPRPAPRRNSAADSTGGSELLRLRGMPFHSTEADVTAFFKGYDIAAGGIKLGRKEGMGLYVSRVSRRRGGH